MVRETQDDANGGGYAAQLETLRSTAKWMMAATAGVGVLLVAGLQLSGLGRLPLNSWRAYTALGATMAALSAVGYMIKIVSAVLVEEWLTLADFTDDATGLPGPRGSRHQTPADLVRIESYLMGSRHELFGYVAPTLSALHSQLHNSHQTMWRTDLDAATREKAAQRSAELRSAARDVVQAANYYHVLHLFKELRTRFVGAAVLGVLGVVVFAYAVNPPQDPGPVKVRIVSNR